MNMRSRRRHRHVARGKGTLVAVSYWNAAGKGKTKAMWRPANWLKGGALEWN